MVRGLGKSMWSILLDGTGGPEASFSPAVRRLGFLYSKTPLIWTGGGVRLLSAGERAARGTSPAPWRVASWPGQPKPATRRPPLLLARIGSPMFGRELRRVARRGSRRLPSTQLFRLRAKERGASRRSTEALTCQSHFGIRCANGRPLPPVERKRPAVLKQANVGPGAI